ncbi:MAG: hypothetical protein DSY46_01925 [Hydrogenimonas sp.]|nr:MAG: hypothetical protein DSY46_01925 [Hydrogenimonas sp.]
MPEKSRGLIDRLAFVILNFKTPDETIQLVHNLEKQAWSSKVKVYIVDNGSADHSLEVFQRLESTIEVEVIASKRNLGFAKGHNLGIQKARLDGFQWIIVSNSDIRLKIDPDFVRKMEVAYEEDGEIAVIAPTIVNLHGMHQNPFRKERFSRKEIIKMKLFYLSGFYKLYYFLRVYILYDLITYIARKRLQRAVASHRYSQVTESGYIYAPHGSFLIFTPTFFKYFDGFDEGTFLYCEEFILAEKLREKGLKCWYENQLNIEHQESKATEKLTGNYREKVKFTLKYTLNSCAYFTNMIRFK